MKKIMSFLLAIIACLLVGCATPTTTDTFRFQVRELELTLGEEKSLDLIMGDFSESEVIVAEQVNKTEESGTVEVLEVKNGVIKIKATGVGKVEFRAYVESQSNVKDTIIITVENEKINYLKLENEKINEKTGKVEIKIDETTTMVVTSYPVIDNIEYVWESSNQDVLTVDNNGNITGVSRGNAYVKVYEKNDPSFSISKEVIVNYLDTESIVTDKETYEIKVGEEVKVIATAYNKDGTTYGVDPTITFSKTTTAITVSNEGVVKGVKTGTYKLKIISGGTSKTVTIIVTEA